MPLWVLSLDLRKVFDKVSHSSLISALQNKGADALYIHMFYRTCQHATGSVTGSHAFDITCDVKQGDITSPLLFIFMYIRIYVFR